MKASRYNIFRTYEDCIKLGVTATQLALTSPFVIYHRYLLLMQAFSKADFRNPEFKELWFEKIMANTVATNILIQYLLNRRFGTSQTAKLLVNILTPYSSKVLSNAARLAKKKR